MCVEVTCENDEVVIDNGVTIITLERKDLQIFIDKLEMIEFKDKQREWRKRDWRYDGGL